MNPSTARAVGTAVGIIFGTLGVVVAAIALSPIDDLAEMLIVAAVGVVSFLLGLAFVWVDFRYTTRRGLRSRSDNRCPMCEYDLRANPDSGCPECGWNRGAQPRRQNDAAEGSVAAASGDDEIGDSDEMTGRV